MPKDQPMISQYLALKEKNKDAVLFFQVGTFYQLYYHDAKLAADILGTRVISRAIGKGQRIPMCGIPKTAGKKYAKAFADKGYRVLLCDQTDEKTESGLTVRRIVEEVKPDADADTVDLSAIWDEDLKAYNFEMAKQTTKKRKMSAEEQSILNNLIQLDLNSMTPMDALNLLQEWKRKYADGISNMV